jgi:hypothetical protein
MTQEIGFLKEGVNVPEVFRDDEKSAALLDSIKDYVLSIDMDATTRSGRAEIISLAAKVSKTKTAVTGMVKDSIEAQKKEIDAIVKRRTNAERFFDELRDQVRQPVTDWENIEKSRVAGHEDAILDIQALGNIISDFTTANIDDAKGYLVDIDKILEHDFQEFKDRATKAADDTKAAINNMIDKKIKYDAEQAELEALRAKQREDEIKAREKAAADAARLEAERLAKEKEDARIAADKAKADKLAAEQKAEKEKAERVAQAAIDKAKADAQAAIDKANADKAKAEQDLVDQKRREDAEKKRLEDEKAAREADQENRKRVNNSAMFALVAHGNISEDQAKAVIIAIAKGLIDNVQINY